MVTYTEHSAKICYKVRNFLQTWLYILNTEQRYATKFTITDRTCIRNCL